MHRNRRARQRARCRCWWILAALLLWPFGAPARAAAESPDGAFYAHYNRAVALYSAGRHEEAVTEFQAAYDIEPLPRLLFNLGQAHLKAGRPRAALSFYHSYQLRAPALGVEARALLRESVQRALDALDAQELATSPEELSGKDPPADGPSGLPPAQASRPAPARSLPPRRSASSSLRRRAVAGVLGGLLGASLLASVTLTALDGRSSGPCVSDGLIYGTCFDHFVVPYGIGYAASGLLLGGLVLTLLVPERRPLR